MLSKLFKVEIQAQGLLPRRQEAKQEVYFEHGRSDLITVALLLLLLLLCILFYI
jgi:hypothetical protein